MAKRDRGRRAAEEPRLRAPWQRTATWAAWIAFVALALRNSASSSMGPAELGALAVALAITVESRWYPLGPRAVFLEEPAELRGEMTSRTSWALVLVGAAILMGGLASCVRIVQHLASGRATVGDVLRDMGVFVVEWLHEIVSGGVHDGKLEQTQAYVLFVLVVPGFFLVLFNLLPFLHRGRDWRVEPDGSVAVRDGERWAPLDERRYATVVADGWTVEWREDGAASPAVVLPQGRVFARALGTRVEPEVLAAFFRERLARRGFAIESRSPIAWTAHRR